MLVRTARDSSLMQFSHREYVIHLPLLVSHVSPSRYHSPSCATVSTEISRYVQLHTKLGYWQNTSDIIVRLR